MKKTIFLYLILIQNISFAQNNLENDSLNIKLEKIKLIIDNTEADSLLIKGNAIQLMARQQKNDLKTSKMLYTASIYAFSNSISRDKNLYESYKERGRNFAYLEEYNLALKDFVKASEYNSSDPILYYLKGISKEKISDYYGAIIDFKNSESLSNDNEFKSKALTKITQNQMLVGINDEIIDNMNKAIQYWSKNAIAYYIRGNYFIIIDELKKGCEDLSKSNELGYTLAGDKIKENCQFKN